MSKKLTIGQDPNLAYLLGSALRCVEWGSRLQLDELKGIPDLTLTQ
jgi:hypothetical protein